MSKRDPVTKDLWDLLGIGVAVQVAGGFGLGLASAGSDEPPMVIVLVTWAVIAAGALVILAAVIGFGVLAGLRARAHEEAGTHRTARPSR